MFMLGAILLISGLVGIGMFPPKKYGWESRDLVGVVPIVTGFVMCIVSLSIWAFRSLP